MHTRCRARWRQRRKPVRYSRLSSARRRKTLDHSNHRDRTPKCQAKALCSSIRRTSDEAASTFDADSTATLLNISMFLSILLLFFLKMLFLSIMTYVFFMQAFSSVYINSHSAISNFKLRFVPRELWNVVVDALVFGPCLSVGKMIFFPSLHKLPERRI